MKHPDKWRDTADPFALPYKSFKPLEILGYPHAGNDVFYVKGLYDGSEINAYIKIARQKGADVDNEISILSQVHSSIFPTVIDYGLEEKPFLVTQELCGERLSSIVGENRRMESLSYLSEYGVALAKIHQMNVKAKTVKDRKFFHSPSDESLKSLNLEYLIGLFPSDEMKTHRCFCHGDFHYANVLWHDRRISGVLDFELSGYGIKEFDIAWAVFRRPNQNFLRTEIELQEFLKGYERIGSCDVETVRAYIAQCYVYFMQSCSYDVEYCEYANEWLKSYAREKH